MKKIKLFGALIAASTICFSSTSCDDDEVRCGVAEVTENPIVKFASTPTEATLSVEYKGQRIESHVAKFTNHTCSSYVTKYTYFDEANKKTFEYLYEKEIASGSITYDGESYIYDRSDKFKGWKSEDVDEYLQAIEAREKQENDRI